MEHRNYIDFVVSGQSLGQLFDIERMNLIGTFGWIKNQAIELNLIDEFLGKSIPELPTGRSSFYVCKECGEIECGAITAQIEFTESRVVWKNFGYERSYDESGPRLDDYKTVGPYFFDLKQYTKVFEMLKEKRINNSEINYGNG